MNILSFIKDTILAIFLMGLFVFFLPALSQADDDFSFGQINLRGSGCKPGTAAIVKTPDEKTMSILFDEFLVEVPQYDNDNDNDEVTEDNPIPSRRSNERLDHKVCQIVINANIPQGFKIKSLETSLDFRGSTQMDKGVHASFRSRLVRWKGPQRRNSRGGKLIVKKEWKKGPIDEDWPIHTKIDIPVNSKCARRGDRETQFVIRNVLMAKIKKRFNPADTFALVTMDSADISGKLKVKIKTQSCGGRGRHNNNGNGNGRGRRRRNERNPGGRRHR